ncbi:MAG: hypothetical protein WBR18_03495 [Anaerolineales bacterium]
MNDLASIIARWETLYLLIGTAAATLMGLLFVSISINVEKFKFETPMDLQNLGGLTFNCFFYVLVIAVLFLTPGLGWTAMGTLLLLLGIADLTSAFLQRGRALRARAGEGSVDLSSRFTFPILCLVGLMIFSVGVFLHIEAALYGVLLVVIFLLGIASVNAWSFLIRVDRPTKSSSN